MRSFSLLLALCAAVSAVNPAHAKDIKGWDLRKGERHCSITSTYESDILIGISWLPVEQETRIMFLNEKWDSLRERKGETTRIAIDLIGKNVENDRWWHNDALIVATDSGSEAIVASWDKSYSKDLAVALMLAEAMQVEADGKNLGGFRLDGTYAAILGLKRCGSELLSEINDPFAG